MNSPARVKAFRPALDALHAVSPTSAVEALFNINEASLYDTVSGVA